MVECFAVCITSTLIESTVDLSFGKFSFGGQESVRCIL